MTTLTEADLAIVIRDLFLAGDPAFPLTADDDLLSAGICDSLGLVQLASEIERRLPGLRIADRDINWDTLGSIDRIRNYLAARSS